MSFFSRRKKHTPSNSAPAIGLASQSQPVYPWSAHPLTLVGHSPSPFPRHSHALSATATAAGELFLFGGSAHDSLRNDLYVFSTRDFSTTLLRTSGETPSPRSGHGAALTSTHLLVWGGLNPSKGFDDSLYLLNLVSREWTRVVVTGHGPGGRWYHTVTLVGSNLFVFGGRIHQGYFDDIWALDLDHLNSNPHWETYEPAPVDAKPSPRLSHVSVTTGDRIIVFGGGTEGHYYNDTWSFDISTRKWTELQCTGSIPFPRTGHAAVLVDDVMYVFGGETIGGTNVSGLTALNLSTQRWTAFQDMGPSPSKRTLHAMASDGTRVFLLGGTSWSANKADEQKLIHVLDTKRLNYSIPDSKDVNPSEKTTPGPLTQRQPQEPTPSSSDAHAAHGAPSFQRAPPGELDHPASSRIIHERLVEVERKLSAMLAAQTERDWRIAQLTDELAQNSALLKQSEANSQRELAEMRAELEARKSELAPVHLRFKDAESGWAKSKADADTSGAAKTAGNLVNTDEDGVMRRLTERMRAMEAEIASLRGNEK